MTTIVIIEPSSSGLGLLVTAKAMGLKVVILSANKDDRIVPAKYHKYIDKLYVIDTFNSNELIKLLKKIHRHSLISAIIPGSEYHVPITAELSAEIGLPGVSPQYVHNLRIKSVMRESLKSAGVRCPKFALIHNIDDIHQVSKVIGFPCVIKPIASAGSMHVTRINNEGELLGRYQAISSDPWSELGVGLGTSALIEEYIAGEEFSVEGYIEDDKPIILSITKKFLSDEPLFIEMGHIVSANIPEEMIVSITNYIGSVIKAIKLNLGIFHAELKYDKNGPVLMEIAGRLPGCRIPDLIYLAKKINLYEVMIRAHLGWSIQSYLSNENCFAGMCYLKLPDTKTSFTKVSGLDELKTVPGFYEFKLLKEPEEYVPPMTNFMSRVATCIFLSDDYDDLISKLELSKSIISFL